MGHVGVIGEGWGEGMIGGEKSGRGRRGRRREGNVVEGAEERMG